jgi:hypothetical protein
METTDEEMGVVTLKCLRKLDREYQHVSLGIAEWVLGGNYPDPSGEHGFRAEALKAVDNLARKQGLTRGEALLFVLASRVGQHPTTESR